MDKSPDAFRTISEAANELDLPQHVLRFWETRFVPIKPLKRGGGRRYYRPDDVSLLKGIRFLLYDQGFTIKGVQRILKDRGTRAVISIGESGEVEPVAAARLEDDQAAPGTELLVPGADHEGDLAQNPALDEKKREKLSEVLRELLACKRLLEAAREG